MGIEALCDMCFNKEAPIARAPRANVGIVLEIGKLFLRGGDIVNVDYFYLIFIQKGVP
jgi:hypothetical protein